MYTKKIVIVLLCMAQALCAYPDSGVFGAIGESFEDLLLQQMYILSLVESLTPPPPVGPCTTIEQADINSGTFVISTSGNYCVTENITAPALFTGPMIEISADNVNLDLQGFTLDGNSLASNIIASNGAIQNLVVKNGLLTGAVGPLILPVNQGTGVYLSGAQSVLLEDVTADDNSVVGILMEGCSDCQLIGCHAAGNAAGALIYMMSSNISLQGASSSDYSFFNNNLTAGVAIDDVNDCVLQWCEASSNNEFGFDLGGNLNAVYGVMRECRASGNGIDNYRVESGSGMIYFNNENLLGGDFDPALITSGNINGPGNT